MSKHDGDYIRGILEKIKIKTIMNKDVIKVHEHDELSKAEEIFLAKRIYYLPVVNQYNKLVGLLSQKYLYKTHSPRKIDSDELAYRPDILIDGNAFYDKEALDSFFLRSVMLKNPFTLTEEDSVLTAIFEMAKRKIGCICIIDGEKKVCGMLTESDLVKLTAQILSS